MTDNEIVKALEVLENLQILAYHDDDGADEYSHKLYEALTITFEYINSQKAKNEALKMDKEQLKNDVFNAEMNRESAEQQLTAMSDLCREQKAEIERLKIEKGNLIRTYAECQAEAVKEFAEMVKNIAGIYQKDTYVIGVDELDNLVKEMVGDNNAE